MNRGRLLTLLALTVTGCAFSGAEGDGTGAGDGTGSGTGSGSGSDVKPDEPPRCKFTFVDVCSYKPVPPARTYTGNTTIDTSVDSNCPHVVAQGEGKPELCVFHDASLTIAQGAVVKATGLRVLVFVTSGAITIAGRLDVSSAKQNSGTSEWVGAAGATATCSDFADAPESSTGGGGGGAGGSFSGKGGNGGSGGSGDGGEAAAALPLASVDFLRGGCRGQIGGDNGGSTNGEPPGAGGPGGGAIYLAAAGEITIETTGRITANGGGGRGGGSISGGGGGGSGGMIVLEAKATHRAGIVTASGGGAGQGGLWVQSGLFAGKYSGGSGEDSGDNGSAAEGGRTLLGGQGGNGTSGTSRNGGNGSNNGTNGGGGAGGGGAGFIRILGASAGAGVIAPPLSN